VGGLLINPEPATANPPIPRGAQAGVIQIPNLAFEERGVDPRSGGWEVRQNSFEPRVRRFRRSLLRALTLEQRRAA